MRKDKRTADFPGSGIDLNKAQEIKIHDFKDAGRVGRLKGDRAENRTVLVVQDFGDGTVQTIIMSKDESIPVMPISRMPKQCINWDL